MKDSGLHLESAGDGAHCLLLVPPLLPAVGNWVNSVPKPAKVCLHQAWQRRPRAQIANRKARWGQVGKGDR